MKPTPEDISRYAIARANHWEGLKKGLAIGFGFGFLFGMLALLLMLKSRHLI